MYSIKQAIKANKARRRAETIEEREHRVAWLRKHRAERAEWLRSIRKDGFRTRIDVSSYGIFDGANDDPYDIFNTDFKDWIHENCHEDAWEMNEQYCEMWFKDRNVAFAMKMRFG